MHIQFSIVQCKKDISKLEGIDHWDGPSGASAQSARLCPLHPWRVSRHNWINPKGTWTDPITDTAGSWAGDIPRSLPIQVIPGFYNWKFLLVINFNNKTIKKGSVLSRKQHKFSIADSCFEWLYFLTLIQFLLYFDGILHFSILTCFSCNSVWQEWCLALQKSRESLNFLINNFKINFACSKPSVLDLVMEYSSEFCFYTVWQSVSFIWKVIFI